MNEHELCCGTVADKAKLCAEIEQRDLIIAAQQRRIGELMVVVSNQTIALQLILNADERGFGIDYMKGCAKSTIRTTEAYFDAPNP